MKKLTLSIAFLFFTKLLFSQYIENQNNLFFTRLGLNTFNELNIFIQPGRAKNTQFSFGAALKFSPSYFDYCSFF